VTALVLLAGGIALLVWLGTVAVGALGGNDAKPPSPSTKTLRIVFPEGFTRQQMADRITAVDEIAKQKRDVTPRLSAAAYLAATASSKLPGRFAADNKRRPLEGFLFPATYDFTQRTTSRRLVRDQLAAFGRTWKRVDLRYARSKNLTRYDVLIIASMIEREVISPRERRLVAAVIYNRLHNRMPLGIDATIRYGLDIPAGRPITQAQLDGSNPYNTSHTRGLPPTPIANPGLPSMEAAAHPAHVNYLYFVRKPDKIHHFFTASLQAFNAYQREHPVHGA
jgi:peptidoglycan lytic transglycosylase G